MKNAAIGICPTRAQPKRKPTKKPKKRGPKEERLVIADDPQTALITLLNFRPAKPARKP